MDQESDEQRPPSLDGQIKAQNTTSDDELSGADVEKALQALTAPMERVPTYLQPRMPFRERLHHFTFAWYTVS